MSKRMTKEKEKEVVAKLEAFIADILSAPTPEKAMALCEYFEELPRCYKDQFVPATNIGALNGIEGNAIPGFHLCDRHGTETEHEFEYAEALRRAVHLLIDLDDDYGGDLGEEPWWIYHYNKMEVLKPPVKRAHYD